MNTRPRIKICCISSWNEAQLAIQYGASALGLVGNMPSGPGVIPDEQILTLTQATPPGVSSFLLTSETEARGIEAHYRKTLPSTIQIVDSVPFSTYKTLRERIPGVKLVQVIHVIGESSLDESLKIAPEVDALLLDSGNPYAAVKELGGTGRTHNWNISRQIVEQVGVPVFLAGGLKAENVQAAVEAVQPYGLDLCSGVRSQGHLDEAKLASFMEQVMSL